MSINSSFHIKYHAASIILLILLNACGNLLDVQQRKHRNGYHIEPGPVLTKGQTNTKNKSTDSSLQIRNNDPVSTSIVDTVSTGNNVSLIEDTSVGKKKRARMAASSSNTLDSNNTDNLAGPNYHLKEIWDTRNFNAIPLPEEGQEKEWPLVFWGVLVGLFSFLGFFLLIVLTSTSPVLATGFFISIFVGVLSLVIGGIQALIKPDKYKGTGVGYFVAAVAGLILLLIITLIVIIIAGGGLF
jgi:hypothetical protein